MAEIENAQELVIIFFLLSLFALSVPQEETFTSKKTTYIKYEVWKRCMILSPQW